MSHAFRSAILVLLLSLANERQPADLRAAVLYCFEAYVHGNVQGKQAIVSTLLPTSVEGPQPATTAGHYLCSMLVGAEPLQVYFGAVCLIHCVNSERTLKEQLLRVQMALSTGSAPTTLLQQVCTYSVLMMLAFVR
jgi:hypothetical protein